MRDVALFIYFDDSVCGDGSLVVNCKIVSLAYLPVYNDNIWYLSFLQCIANVGWLLCQKVNLMKSVFGVLGDWMIGWYF
jgi:hypothetical protein